MIVDYAGVLRLAQLAVALGDKVDSLMGDAKLVFFLSLELYEEKCTRKGKCLNKSLNDIYRLIGFFLVVNLK